VEWQAPIWILFGVPRSRGQSSRGLEHSKTLRANFHGAWKPLAVLDCGDTSPLFPDATCRVESESADTSAHSKSSRPAISPGIAHPPHLPFASRVEYDQKLSRITTCLFSSCYAGRFCQKKVLSNPADFPIFSVNCTAWCRGRQDLLRGALGAKQEKHNKQ
jgi:hypothetical protein